jgi:hypothetical protein
MVPHLSMSTSVSQKASTGSRVSTSWDVVPCEVLRLIFAGPGMMNSRGLLQATVPPLAVGDGTGGKVVAEVHDYHDVNTPVLGSSLARRAPGYRSLGFPDPRCR